MHPGVNNNMMLHQVEASHCTSLHVQIVITAFFCLATVQSLGFMCCRAEAAPPKRCWWHRLKRSTAVSPSPDTSSCQFLWTDPKHCSQGLLAHDPCKTLPGTCSTAIKIIQVLNPPWYLTFPMMPLQPLILLMF